MPARAGFSFTTAQGVPVQVRLMQDDDTDHLINLFDHLGAESRYNRFHQPLNHPSEERVRQGAEQLARVEPGQGVAWIAFTERDGAVAPIAVARYNRLNETQAEPALTVRDEFQGQGIGRTLFNHLIAAATREYIRQFIATIQPGNQAAIRLVQNAGFPYTQTVEDGQMILTMNLDERDE